MRASNQEFHSGIAMMKSSTPDGNAWPFNDAEWKKRSPHSNKWVCQKTEAQTLARMTHGGSAGRLLLETAQLVDRERHA